MDPLELSGQMEIQVVGPVIVTTLGSDLEDGVGTVEAPAGPGYPHPIVHEVSARALDHAGGDGPAGRDLLL